jgi:hypothetical protein
MSNRLAEIVATYGPQAEALKEEALVVAATARERFAEERENLQESIVNNPARALGVALGVGVVLGWLIKRQ